MMVGLRSFLWKSPIVCFGMDLSSCLGQQLVGYATGKGLSCLNPHVYRESILAFLNQELFHEHDKLLFAKGPE